MQWIARRNPLRWYTQDHPAAATAPIGLPSALLSIRIATSLFEGVNVIHRGAPYRTPWPNGLHSILANLPEETSFNRGRLERIDSLVQIELAGHEESCAGFCARSENVGGCGDGALISTAVAAVAKRT